MKVFSFDNVTYDVLSFIKNNDLIGDVGIFGSLSRGDFNENSDIDICVAFKSYDDIKFDEYIQYLELCENLRERFIQDFGRNVDMVQFDIGRPYNTLNKHVEGDMKWIYQSVTI